MSEARPVEITFDTKEKVTGLEVVARLHAANKFAEPAIQIVAWNVQAAVGPSPAKVGPYIKS